jgi:hypothetical protein
MAKSPGSKAYTSTGDPPGISSSRPFANGTIAKDGNQSVEAMELHQDHHAVVQTVFNGSAKQEDASMAVFVHDSDHYPPSSQLSSRPKAVQCRSLFPTKVWPNEPET